MCVNRYVCEKLDLDTTNYRTVPGNGKRQSYKPRYKRKIMSHTMNRTHKSFSDCICAAIGWRCQHRTCHALRQIKHNILIKFSYVIEMNQTNKYIFNTISNFCSGIFASQFQGRQRIKAVLFELWLLI